MKTHWGLIHLTLVCPFKTCYNYYWGLLQNLDDPVPLYTYYYCFILQFKPNKASADDVTRHEMSRMNEKVAAMKQPEERAKNYLALSQFTIILSIVCFFWPYNFVCLVGVYILSKMVILLAI